MSEIPKPVPDRWQARYEDCMGPEIWYSAEEMAGVLEELGAAEARIRELEQARDREAGRWQKEIYDLIRKHVPRPDDIDGGGCDSGDPLDLTLDEIGQGFAQLKSDGNPLSPYCGSGEMGIECEKPQLQARIRELEQALRHAKSHRGVWLHDAECFSIDGSKPCVCGREELNAKINAALREADKAVNNG